MEKIKPYFKRTYKVSYYDYTQGYRCPLLRCNVKAKTEAEAVHKILNKGRRVLVRVV